MLRSFDSGGPSLDRLRAFGGASGKRVLAESDEGLVALARELGALMGLEAEPVLARVFRFEKAPAQMRVGHLATMRTARERLAGRPARM